MTLRCDIAYVVQSEDGSVVKVGFSGNPKMRVSQITQTMPFPMRLVALISNGKVAERQMKELLSPWKLRGEWFQPRPELNEFLAQKRAEGRLVISIPVDDAYCEKYIKPEIINYLSGRQPSMSEPGDMVFRFLQEGAKVIVNRMSTLHGGLKGEISTDILGGFVPLPHDAPDPCVIVNHDAFSKEAKVAVAKQMAS